MNSTALRQERLKSSKIMDEKLQDLIKKSGNNLHVEVAESLEKMGWDVDISSYYHDDITDKPREIDIIAEKGRTVTANGRGSSYFNVFLFIECKYFENEIAFRIYDNRKGEGISSIIFQGMSENILDDSNTNLKKTHHYVSVPSVAKLYDAKENNEVFNAVTGAVKSLIFFKEHLKGKGLYYPVVVYSGIDGLYPVEGSDFSKLNKIKPVKNLTFSLNYSYRSTVSERLETRRFYVDFIHKQELGKFIATIEKKEISEVAGFAHFLLLKGRKL